MTSPELSRSYRVDAIGAEPRRVELEADEAEKGALAGRFGLVAIEELRAEAELVRKGAEVRARGAVRASVIQSCVATADPVDASIDAPFDIVFRPQPEPGRPDEEVELSEAELDVVFYDGAAIDLGEAVAETLALSLDPYPRAPGADAALKEAGVKDEAEAGPFGALAGLRDKLKK